MKLIIIEHRIHALGPHPGGCALGAAVFKRVAASTISLVAVLRDARKSVLLRTKVVVVDFNMIRTWKHCTNPPCRSAGHVRASIPPPGPCDRACRAPSWAVPRAERFALAP